MAIISIPFTFSAGAVIIAAQHNTNFSTIYNDYSGNIQNVNIASGAAIAYSKLALTGGILNADINSSAAIATSKINFGSNHQGDVFVDNGSGITRITPGTNGQFLQTQGGSANVQWATPTATPVTSNTLFQYSAMVDGIFEVTSTSSFLVNTTGSYRYIVAHTIAHGSSQLAYKTKWKKISGVNTVTIYGQIWLSGGSGDTVSLQVDIGGQNSSVAGSVNQNTPEWNTFTIDVSSLSNGTTYDVTATLINNSSSNTENLYMGNLIAFGS